MQGGEAEDQVAAGDADNFAAGEEAGESVERGAIVGVVESGDDYEFVGNVKIGVAGGQALASEVDGRGHGERFDAIRAAGGIGHGFEGSETFLEGEVGGVGGVLLDAAADGGGTEE